MAQRDVRAGAGEESRARHKIDVEPGMHAQPLFVRETQRQRERIEMGRVVFEFGRARFDAAVVVRIAAAAHLHEQRVESRALGGIHHLPHIFLRAERRAKHPQSADVVIHRFRAVERYRARRRRQRQPEHGGDCGTQRREGGRSGSHQNHQL